MTTASEIGHFRKSDAIKTLMENEKYAKMMLKHNEYENRRFRGNNDENK
jgi:hypothetical protein